MKTALSVAVLGVLISCTLAHAQSPHSTRVALTGSVGLTKLPDAIGSKCGQNGGESGWLPEIAAGVLFRPWPMLVIQADIRQTASVTGDCSLVGVAIDTAYTRQASSPLAGAALRVGLEAPPASPVMFRVTGGVGRLAGRPGKLFTAIGGSIGMRGPRRPYLEFERMKATLDAYELRRFTSPPVQRTIKVTPVWQIWRVGYEFGF